MVLCQRKTSILVFRREDMPAFCMVIALGKLAALR
jgi:hypothetical protein